MSHCPSDSHVETELVRRQAASLIVIYNNIGGAKCTYGDVMGQSAANIAVNGKRSVFDPGRFRVERQKCCLQGTKQQDFTERTRERVAPAIGLC